ncbi:MAG: hypothetical protein NTV82_01140 [Candidatus Aminicenantes bacterium]|nr:hypothetical protein [Candidatus Aminicenantes bacterium]
MSEKTILSAAKLKREFVRLLTEDSPHRDARRKDFNQTIFDVEKGFAVFNGTDMGIVMEKFNKAVANLMRYHISEVLFSGNDNRKFYTEGYGSLPDKEEI